MRWAAENVYNGLIDSASARHGVPSALIKATIGVESGFNPRAMNYADPGYAWGLMQMIPVTARGLGYAGPMSALVDDPALAIDLGTKLLKENLRRAGGSIADSVSAYNGGFRPTLGFGAKRPNGTYGNQAYVDKVMNAYHYFAPGTTDLEDLPGDTPNVPSQDVAGPIPGIVIAVTAAVVGLLVFGKR